MKPSRVGDQLELWGDDERVPKGEVPWGGQSPRELTRGYALGLDKGFILKTQGAKSVGDDGACEQYDLWLPIKKAPWKYQGAPLLGGPKRPVRRR